MQILFLAPQPFFLNRGTPIAVHLALRSLSEAGHTIDLLTYHEGEDRSYPGVTHHRITPPPFCNHLRPGLTFKKVLCDVSMFFRAIRLHRKSRPQLIHAGEESVYFALFLKMLFRTPYIYDMDSSMAQQIVEKHPRLKILASFLEFFEGIAIKHADAVLPVCQALADLAQKHHAKRLTLLRDISLLEIEDQEGTSITANLPEDGVRFMYIGNLEPYQGIDLLLDAFAEAASKNRSIHLIIVGGDAATLKNYRLKARDLDIDDLVSFTGPLPTKFMGHLFSCTDVLVSPRCKGLNTPMKIYSYLHSRKAVLATDLPTHTQVMRPEFTYLVKPEKAAMAKAISDLAEDAALRERLGQAGKAFIEEHNCFRTYKETLYSLYDQLNTDLRLDEKKS